MNLKRVILKNTWYITVIFIAFSTAANLCMVSVAKKIEEIISRLEVLRADSLLETAAMTGVFCALYVVFSFGYWFLYNCVTKKASRLSVEYAYSNYLTKQLGFFADKGAGDIAYSTISLAEDVGVHYATFWPMLFIQAVTLLILFGTVALYNVLFSVFVILVIGLLIFFTSFISGKLADRTAASESLAAEINSRIVQSFEGISVIKAFRREGYFAGRYRTGLSAQKYRNDIVRDFWYSLYTVIYEVMTVIFPVMVLLSGFLLRERNLLSAGAVVAVYSIAGLMQEPVREIADSVTLYRENADREKKLGEILEPRCARTAVPEVGRIQLDVAELKIGDRMLAKDVCFEIGRGDMISLQGPSGCGKSTLLKLIVGFVQYEGCSCRYDGVLQHELPDEVRYANISLVEQKPFLFTASIKENIMLGEEFGQDLLEEVLQVCMLEKLVKEYGLEKEIDWAAGNISGGEMQRITIARAIIRRPGFLLLDEVTASLDAATAEQVAGNIAAFARKYRIAVVAVSHKDEFVKFSNKKIDLISYQA